MCIGRVMVSPGWKAEKTGTYLNPNRLDIEINGSRLQFASFKFVNLIHVKCKSRSSLPSYDFCITFIFYFLMVTSCFLETVWLYQNSLAYASFVVFRNRQTCKKINSVQSKWVPLISIFRREFSTVPPEKGNLFLIFHGGCICIIPLTKSINIYTKSWNFRNFSRTNNK